MVVDTRIAMLASNYTINGIAPEGYNNKISYSNLLDNNENKRGIITFIYDYGILIYLHL